MSKNETTEQKKIVIGHKGCAGCAALIVGSFFVLMIIVIATSQKSPEEKRKEQTKIAGYNAASACQDWVRVRLKAPRTAEFQELREAQIEWIPNEGTGVFKVTSYVDSQNGFGAMLRMPYTCTAMTTDDKNFNLASLDLR
jgi:hypothetical protein